MGTSTLKKLTALFLLLVFIPAVTLTGCGTGKQQSVDKPGEQEEEDNTEKPADDVQAEYTIKFAHAGAATKEERMHQGALIFKAMAEEMSGGRVKVELYPSGQLGHERELFEGVQMGTIEMAIMSDGAIAGFVPEIMVIGVPYIFRSAAIAYEVLDGPFGQQLMEKMLKRTGVRFFSLTEQGFRNFTSSNKLIKSPQDLAGMKIRTMEHPGHMAMLEALGGSPTPVAWEELYSSLQQGVVVGQENPVSTILRSKLYEVQNYLTLDGHVYGVNPLVINDAYFKSLPEDIRQVLVDAAEVMTMVARSTNQIITYEGIAELKERGMVVYTPNPTEMQEFASKAQGPVIEWLKSELGDQLVDDFLAAVEEVENNLAQKTQ